MPNSRKKTLARVFVLLALTVLILVAATMSPGRAPAYARSAEVSQPQPDEKAALQEVLLVLPSQLPAIKLDELGPYTQELAGDFEHVFATAHPDLPPQIRAALSGALAVRLVELLGGAPVEYREQLSESVRRTVAEIRNLPFTKSQQHLEYATAWVLNEASYWSAVFKKLMGRSDLEHPEEVNVGTTVLAKALEQLYGQGQTPATALLEEHKSMVEEASKFYFSPEGKFPLRPEQVSLLERDLAAMVAEAQKKISDGQAASPTVLERIEEDVKRYTARDMRIRVHSEYKKAVPQDFAPSLTLPEEYQAEAQRLIKWSEELRKQEQHP